DPLKQIRHASGSLIGRLLTAVNWSEAVKTEVTVASGEIQMAFGKESGVVSIQDALSENWRIVHDGSVYGGVAIRPIGKRFEDVLRNIEAVFSPSPGSTEDPLERLSDGQRSLFYLAMVGAIFDIEEHVLASDAVGAHFDSDRVAPPSLTIIALEEPENHIAPHYLGRIMDLLRRIAGTRRAQVILTSHSTSIMHRVEPTEVRHVRLDPASRASLVRSIALPAETDEAYKFIREAVQAFPELYFARFVILGEGDSEEIVLPRISEALGVRVDQSFVSVVPLGGRHVNHFWRLLHSLNIPYVTLLDFDLEREGGGWGRIKYALNQLIAVGTPKSGLLGLADGTQLSDKHLAEMHGWDVTNAHLSSWQQRLEEYGVFFSAPLDLDFLMLTAYPDAYKALETGATGPNIPKQDATDYGPRLKSAIQAVLKDAGGDGRTYGSEAQVEFFWYRYLFLGRGKPTTHLRALASLSGAQLNDKCPPVLGRLILRMQQSLNAPSTKTGNGTKS
ncbi:MAG: AAA family ATPase, partial [Planctomycetes bacterium]|nr:AAA family ATPase [Planctomycetota bacterium]